MTEPRGAVVVTGASTGIGRATALRLARAGHRVFAAVRKTADADGLRAEGVAGLEPILMDVTDAASIAAAAKAVEADLAGSGLAGLVNNAGITFGGPIEYVRLDDLRQGFEVNTFGPVAVAQAFLPFLRRSRGRIVLVSSIGGRVAGPIIGPYSASKFALEALGDALRLELRPFGLHVAIVEPGAIATAIFAKGRTLADDIIDVMPAQGRERYEASARTVVERFNSMERQALSPDRVARAIEHALTAARPRLRYLVGPDARVRAFLAWLLPGRLHDWLTLRLFGLG